MSRASNGHALSFAAAMWLRGLHFAGNVAARASLLHWQYDSAGYTSPLAMWLRGLHFSAGNVAPQATLLRGLYFSAENDALRSSGLRS
jgi:hypothetical protein